MAMQGYNRDEYENLDEYEEEEEDEDEDQEDEEVGEDEYEDEEARQPTEQELEYLELRQRLKESIRKQMKKDSGSLANSGERKNNCHMTTLQNNKVHGSAPLGSRPRVNDHPPKVTNAIKTKTKVQMLKNTRDYSFLLSDDAEPPAPAKDPPPQNVAVSRPEARLDQVPLKSKQLSSNNCQKMFNAGEEWRYMPTNRKMESKVGPHKLASRSRPMSPMDRKQHGSNNGSGPGRPQAPKGIPSKVPLISTEKKIISSSAKNFIPVMRKPLVSKSQPSIPKQTLDRRRELQESSKGKFLSRQQVSSKPQIKQPSTKVPSHGTSQRDYPEKRPIRHYSDDYEDEEGGEAISMIRRMFGYNPNKFTDEGDDSDMEANFNDILKEERRSEKIAQKEDEEELRKIEEEERREGLRKVAKKRKLSRRQR